MENENTEKLESTQEIPTQHTKKQHHFLRHFFIVLVIAAAVCAVALILFTQAKSKVVSKVSDSVIETTAEQLGVPPEEVSNITESMDDEDKEQVETIVENHLNDKTIAKVKKYIDDGDMAGAKQYAQGQLSADEYNTLKDIAQKYINVNDAISQDGQ